MKKNKGLIVEDKSLLPQARFLDDYLEIQLSGKYADTNVEANPHNSDLGEISIMAKVLFTLTVKYAVIVETLERYLEDLAFSRKEVEAGHVAMLQHELDEVNELLSGVQKKFRSVLGLHFPAINDRNYRGHNIIRGLRLELLTPEIGKKQ